MSPRMRLLRDLVLFALGLMGLIGLLVAGGLTVGGAFSLLWFARVLLVVALLLWAVEFAMLPRALRVRQVRGPLDSWRRTDRKQGCSLILLGGLTAFGLLVCSGLLELWLEFR